MEDSVAVLQKVMLGRLIRVEVMICWLFSFRIIRSCLETAAPVKIATVGEKTALLPSKLGSRAPSPLLEWTVRMRCPHHLAKLGREGRDLVHRRYSCCHTHSLLRPHPYY